MYLFNRFIIFLAVFTFSSGAFGYAVGGTQLPDKLLASGKPLILNGAGVRTKFVLNLYVGGLYLGKKNNDAAKIINTDEAMAIRLKIISGFITSEKMVKATQEGFINSTGSKTAPIQAQIKQFMAAFKDKIRKGDEYDFIYSPATGTKVIKNRQTITTIKTLAFKKALFGIWLSNKPAQQSLKKEMLGMKIENNVFQ